MLAGVAIAVVRPDLSLQADGPTGRPSPSSSPNTPPVSKRLDGIKWAPRGDLVDDRAFVSAALGRIRDERPDARRLFFAGRLPDGSRLVLAGTDINTGVVASQVHALLVPAGLAVEVAEVSEAAALTSPAQVLAWAARAANDRVYAVALSRPGPVRFQISARVRFSDAGAPRRLWTPIYAEDGVLVADLGRETDPIMTVRADGPGVFKLRLVLPIGPRRATGAIVPVDGVDADGFGEPAAGYEGPTAIQVSRALRAQAGSVIDLSTATRRLLWSGAPWRQTRLALVLLTRPDGQRFQALVAHRDSREFPAGMRALPRGAPAELPWLLEPFSSQDPTLLLCPSGPGSLIYQRAGRDPLTIPIKADGVAALVAPGPSAPSAGGAEVRLFDEEGDFVMRTTLPMPGFDDPLDLN